MKHGQKTKRRPQVVTSEANQKGPFDSPEGLIEHIRSCLISEGYGPLLDRGISVALREESRAVVVGFAMNLAPAHVIKVGQVLSQVSSEIEFDVAPVYLLKSDANEVVAATGRDAFLFMADEYDSKAATAAAKYVIAAGDVKYVREFRN